MVLAGFVLGLCLDVLNAPETVPVFSVIPPATSFLEELAVSASSHTYSIRRVGCAYYAKLLNPPALPVSPPQPALLVLMGTMSIALIVAQGVQ